MAVSNSTDGELPSDLTAAILEVNQAHLAFNTAVHDAVEHAIECGKKLLEIKAKLRHGEFTDFVAKHLSFGIRTAQRYMRAAERPKLQLKNDTVSLLTEAGVRAAIADDSRDGTVQAVEKIVEVTSVDVVDDLIGPEAVANKTTIRKLAEMNPAGIRHATAFHHGLSWRKASVRDSVRRSQQAKKQQEAKNAVSGEWTTHAPPQLQVEIIEPCPDCGHREYDDRGACRNCQACPAPVEEPDGATMDDMIREVMHFARGILERYPVSYRNALAHQLRGMGDEILENGDLGA